jgi:diacylglycerol kinase family enzyme
MEIVENQPQFYRTTFILNPRSGILGPKGLVIRQLDRIWGAANRKYSVLVTTRPGEGERLAREEAARGSELIVAVGGDGTLNEVVRGTLGTKACVGLIPNGSGNGYARHWNIPLKAEKACRALLNPRLVACDLGYAEDRPFMVTFGCGIDADISARYSRSTVRGMAPYIYHVFYALREYQSSEVRVHQNGTMLYSGKPLLLTLANARGYGGGTVLAPQARADDGWLDLCIVDDLPFKQCLRKLPNLFNGNLSSLSGYHHFQVQEVRLERGQAGLIHVDGDSYHGGSDIRIRIAPGVVPFALPA